MTSRRRLGAAVLVAWSIAGCGRGADPGTEARQRLLARLGGAEPARGDEVFEVWVCHVPADTVDALYQPGLPRLAIDPAVVARLLDEHVGRYFATISGGRYRPGFRPGGEVSLGVADDSQDCADLALDGARADSDAVLLVADAEHAGDRPGGWGRPANPRCRGRRCPAGESRRAVYVGAGDFHLDWGPVPALDLIEHEIGHSLGWPHSAAPGPGGEHASPLDLMSDSAAPRAVDAARRDGPDVLAVERLLAGWLTPDEVVGVTPVSGRVALDASSAGGAARGWPRLAVGSLGGDRVVTIEAVAAVGYDDHLPSGGISLHVIDLAAEPLLPTVLVDAPEGLLHVGEAWQDDVLRIEVVGPTEVVVGIPSTDGTP